MRYTLFLGFLLFSLLTTSQDIKQKDGLYYINGDLFSGIFTQTDGSGQITAKLNIKNGKFHGKSEYYFTDGSIIEIRTFRNGDKHGTWLQYNENGALVSLAKYRRDKKHGNWKIWDDAGQLRYSLNYKNGEKSGVWEMWDENGVSISKKKY